MSGFSAKLPKVLKGFDASSLSAKTGKLSELFTQKISAKPILAGLNALGGNGFRRGMQTSKALRNNDCRDLVKYDPAQAEKTIKEWKNLPTISDKLTSFSQEAFNNPLGAAKKAYHTLSPLAQAAAPATQAYQNLNEIRNIMNDPYSKGMRGKAVTLNMASALVSSGVAGALFKTGKTEGKIKSITKDVNNLDKKVNGNKEEIISNINEIQVDLLEKSESGDLDYETTQEKTKQINRLKMQYSKEDISSFKPRKELFEKRQVYAGELEKLLFKNLAGNLMSQGASISASKTTDKLKVKSEQKKAEFERRKIIQNPEILLKSFEGTLPQLSDAIRHDKDLHTAVFDHVKNKRNMYSEDNIQNTLEKFEGNLQDLSDHILPDHALFNHVLQQLPSFPALAVKFGLDVG